MSARPGDDRARPGHDRFVVQHEDRDITLPGQALDLSPVLCAFGQRPQLELASADHAVLVRQASVVQRLGGPPARMGQRRRKATARLPHLARVHDHRDDPNRREKSWRPGRPRRGFDRRLGGRAGDVCELGLSCPAGLEAPPRDLPLAGHAIGRARRPHVISVKASTCRGLTTRRWRRSRVAMTASPRARAARPGRPPTRPPCPAAGRGAAPRIRAQVEQLQAWRA